MKKTIYLVETVDFIDGYWGYAYQAEKAFTTREAAEQYLSSLGDNWRAKEGRIIEIQLEEGGETN